LVKSRCRKFIGVNYEFPVSANKKINRADFDIKQYRTALGLAFVTLISGNVSVYIFSPGKSFHDYPWLGIPNPENLNSAINSLAESCRSPFSYFYQSGENQIFAGRFSGIPFSMDYTFLGKADLRISRIGFGCMSLGQDRRSNEQLILRSLDLGVNFFDTADLYQQGENEISLGKSIQSVRKQVVISTKVGNQWRTDGSGWDWNPRKSHILWAADQSLRRLKTDFLDLYQLHGGTEEDPFDEILEAFESLKKQGKIRYFGISSIRPAVIRKYAGASLVSGVMMQYSLLDRRPEETSMPLLSAHGIGLLARGCVAKGLLAGKPPTPYLDYSADEVNTMVQGVRSLQREGRNAAQIALQFVLRSPAVSTAVVGFSRLNQLEEAVSAISGTPLSTEEIAFLENILTPALYSVHR
jgi:aryl-alcohol dehydrogenase-like predicted oxidoreductase